MKTSLVALTLAALVISAPALAWENSRNTSNMTGSRVLDSRTWTSTLRGGVGIDSWNPADPMHGGLNNPRGTVYVSGTGRFDGKYSWVQTYEDWERVGVAFYDPANKAVGGYIAGSMAAATVTRDPRKITIGGAVGAATAAWNAAWEQWVESRSANDRGKTSGTGSNCPCTTSGGQIGESN